LVADKVSLVDKSFSDSLT